MKEQTSLHLSEDIKDSEGQKNFVNKARFQILILSLLSATIAYYVAKHKKRNRVIWIFTCFILNIVGLAILFLLPSNK